MKLFNDRNLIFLFFFELRKKKILRKTINFLYERINFLVDIIVKCIGI